MTDTPARPEWPKMRVFIAEGEDGEAAWLIPEGAIWAHNPDDHDEWSAEVDPDVWQRFAAARDAMQAAIEEVVAVTDRDIDGEWVRPCGHYEPSPNELCHRCNFSPDAHGVAVKPTGDTA